MPTFKITLAYDGTNYVGWQRQAAGPSIQGAVEDALRAIGDADVAVAGAGRTDAGVHALGQVASFVLGRDMDPQVLQRALNGRLPRDIRVVAAARAPEAFHARFSAKTKTYRYRICNASVVSPFERRYVWHVPVPLAADAMDAAARELEGRHDFAAFQTAGTATRTTERTVLASRVMRVASAALPQMEPADERFRSGELVVYEVTGDGFLRHMVRAVAGTLVDIGRGRWPPGRMREVLASRSRGAAGPTVPPEGLFLVAVEYGDL
jgi:tRNA pseudouridine38-40 synthase